MVRDFIDACAEAIDRDPHTMPLCRVVSPLTILKWYEGTTGKPRKECPAVDWSHAPTLDCIGAGAMEWAHSIPMDKWENAEPGFEYKVRVAEWVLNCTKDDLLVPASDLDSHAPLLAHIQPNHHTKSELRSNSDLSMR